MVVSMQTIDQIDPKRFVQMKVVGNVLSLYLSPLQSAFPEKREEIKCDRRGVQGDRHYNSDIDRSVLITTKESYHLARNNGIALSYGVLGENLLIDYNPYHLPPGQRLLIGEVLLEVSQLCPLCRHLSHIDKALPKLLQNNRGVFMKVIEPGTIKAGDSITLLF